ncbi:MAG: zinc-binding dehydrogenase [Phycisphaerales bacterium]|jgi:NADPH:quinone reductase-like Zn-dependent oxidoreductase|nr:zinc-binding dehydrogenase [Phycisphaerales bacterium]
MRALCITAHGDPVAPQVELIEIDSPVPSAGEVLVQTEASALNHLDLWVGRGLPGVETVFPHVGGSDGCGRVVEVGAGVDDAWLGRRVMLNAAVEAPQNPLPDAAPAGRDLHVIGEHTHGTHAERFTAPAANLFAIDDSTDPHHAAAFALTHLTAWRMLRSRARLKEGQTVLITGIGGGVATACLGIAKHLGCRAIVTSRHASKLAAAVALGADETVLDEGEDWSRTVRGMTGRRGVDVCADSIGAAVHHSCLKSLARGGRFVTCGCTTGPNPPTDLARIFWGQLEILGSTMGDAEEFRQVCSLLQSGLLRPVIDRVVPAEEGPTAYAHLESGAQFGKVVLDWT